MLQFFIFDGVVFALMTVWYLAYWLESGNRVRFSLRTLLIATTLFAALLALAVWAVSYVAEDDSGSARNGSMSTGRAGARTTVDQAATGQ